MSQNDSCTLTCKITFFLFAKSGHPTRDRKESGWREAELAGGAKTEYPCRCHRTWGRQGRLQLGAQRVIVHSGHGHPKPRCRERERERKSRWSLCVITFHLQGDLMFSNQPTLLHVYPESLLSRRAVLPQSPPEGSRPCVEGASCPLGFCQQLSNWVTFLQGCPCLSYVPI